MKIFRIFYLAVVLTGGIDRRSNTPTSPTDRTDSNLDERVTDFFALKFIFPAIKINVLLI